MGLSGIVILLEKKVCESGDGAAIIVTANEAIPNEKDSEMAAYSSIATGKIQTKIPTLVELRTKAVTNRANAIPAAARNT